MAVAMGMAMGVTVAVGAVFRVEGGLNRLQHQTAVLQQMGQHRIVQQPQLLAMDLHRHMAVTQVISRLKQCQGVGGLHPQQRLGGRLHQHPLLPLLGRKQLPGLQGLPPRQLQKHRFTGGAVAQSAQTRALLCGERQPPHLPWRNRRRPQTAAQHQGAGGWLARGWRSDHGQVAMR